MERQGTRPLVRTPDDLRAAVAGCEVLLLVGPGVSIAASDGAAVVTWHGLLWSAADCCVAAGLATPEEARRWKSDLRTGGPVSSQNAAQQIEERLRASTGQVYRDCLAATLGTLRPIQTDVLQPLAALHRGGLPLVTTAYDGLLEGVGAFDAYTSLDEPAISRLLSGTERGVLHLFGFWEQPDSIGLDLRTTDAAVRASLARILEHLAPTVGVVLVGFNASVVDPQVDVLLAALLSTFAGTGRPIYRLARMIELAELQSQMLPNDVQLDLVPYGERWHDLAPFLDDLAAALPTTVTETIASKRTGITNTSAADGTAIGERTDPAPGGVTSAATALAPAPRAADPTVGQVAPEEATRPAPSTAPEPEQLPDLRSYPSRKLSPDEYQELYATLLEAIITLDALETMVRLYLNTSLDRIVGPGLLGFRMLGVIDWAESQDQMPLLLDAARRQNPNNLRLRCFIKRYTAE